MQTPLNTQFYQENFPLHNRGFYFGLTSIARGIATVGFGIAAGFALDADLDNYRILLWIFAACAAHSAGTRWRPPGASERLAVVREHLLAMHAYYGVEAGVRIARKHIGWYFEHMGLGASKREFNRLGCAAAQLRLVERLAADAALIGHAA